jgi:hypothetical protein
VLWTISITTLAQPGTAENAFHGTGISLFQFPTRADPGESRPPVAASPSRTKQHSLPDSYAIVPAVALKASAE